jgi:hypothetical protein
MHYPHCASAMTKAQAQKITLGSQAFHCSAGKRSCYERTGTSLNILEYPVNMVQTDHIRRRVVVLPTRSLHSVRFLDRLLIECSPGNLP